MASISREELDKELLFEPEGRWYVGRLNLLSSVRPTSMPSRVIVKDETLREGEETPGVHLSIADKLLVVRKLEEAGVTEMEVGYAGSIPEHFEFTRALLAEGAKMRLSSHARAYARQEEWRQEVERVAESRAKVISFVGSVSECRIGGRPWLSKAQYPDLVYQMVSYAKSLGLVVAFGLADPVRSQLKYVLECCTAAASAGLDRYYVYDGPGGATPEAIAFLTRLARDSTGAQIAVHCHDDFGLATANTLAAVQAGAEVVDVVVNGLGDRAGNAPLEEVVAALTVLYQVETGIALEQLLPLSRLVAEVFRMPVPPNKALVGDNPYRHATDSHIADILRGGWYTYENIRAEALGHTRRLEFGPAALNQQPSGAVGSKIEAMGLAFDAKQLAEVLHRLREVVAEKGFASEEELEDIIREVVPGAS